MRYILGARARPHILAALRELCGSECTPLYHAAWHGHVETVKILLTRNEVNPDKPNNGGDTPLDTAAWYGHEEIVRILLACNEVDPDKPSNGGYTPLATASWHGHAEIVKMLLAREEVNLNKQNIA